jgi:hypothetical protein
MNLSSVFLKRVALSFVRAFAASLLVFAIGLAQAPEFSFSKSAGLAALTAAVTAGLRAIQHALESS